MRHHLTLCLAAGALLLAGCAAKPAPFRRVPPPDFKPIPAEVLQCGAETLGHGDGYDAKMRDCLWLAFTEGRPAAFTTTSLTIEGDPITYSVKALAASHGPGPRFSLQVDSDDHFGKPGLFNYTCNAIERLPYQQDANRYGFRLSGCSGDSSERDLP